jgi:hypothetical protein
MFKNVFYDTRSSIIHLWEQDEKGDNYRNIKWVPYVFEESDRGHIRTLEGKKVFKKTFKNYNEYKRYYENTYTYEDNVRPDIQFLSEVYHSIPEDEMYVPNLRMYFIDIEVHIESEFPKPEEAKYPIVLISIVDSKTKKTFVFGVKDYSGAKDIVFIKCDDEIDLLKKFITFMHNYNPDVSVDFKKYIELGNYD